MCQSEHISESPTRQTLWSARPRPWHPVKLTKEKFFVDFWFSLKPFLIFLIFVSILPISETKISSNRDSDEFWATNPPNCARNSGASSGNGREGLGVLYTESGFSRFAWKNHSNCVLQESLLKKYWHPRPKSHPIVIPINFEQPTHLTAPGTRVLAPETAGKVSGFCIPNLGFWTFPQCFTFSNETTWETVYR